MLHFPKHGIHTHRVGIPFGKNKSYIFLVESRIAVFEYFCWYYTGITTKKYLLKQIAFY